MMYPVYHDGLLLMTLIYWKSMVDDGYNENLANSIVSSIVSVYMDVNVCFYKTTYDWRPSL